MNKIKIIRTSTIPLSLNVLLKGQLKFLNKHFDVIGVSSSGPDLQEVEKRENIKVVAIKMERGISPFKDIIALARLFYFFKRERPTLVHSITPKAGLLSMVAAKLAKVPIRMHTFTGLIFPSKTGILRAVLIYMDRLLCLSATHIYPEGIGVRNDLIAYNITRKPLKIIANGNVNGIDLNYFSPDKIIEIDHERLKRRIGIGERDFVFIFVGRLVRDKGLNELVKAFKELEDRYSKLLLVGPFEADIDPLETDTLEELRNNANIISVGFQKDVRPFFSVSSCLVFPSYREGMPNVVMQAGAMGLPAIVTNINGCNEIIIGGKNGIIVPSKDVEALKSAMTTVKNDYLFRKHLQANARRMIQDRYDQQLVWSSLLTEYESLTRCFK